MTHLDLSKNQCNNDCLCVCHTCTPFISKDQLDVLLDDLEGRPDICRDILKVYEIEGLEYLHRSKFQSVRLKIKKIIKNNEEYEKLKSKNGKK